jgi:hypothetical protein
MMTEKVEANGLEAAEAWASLDVRRERQAR